MDRAGVERALVWLKPRYDKQIEPENRAVHAACACHPERLLGFGWVNPMLGHDATGATIQRVFEEYDLLGIKFNGAQDGYVIDNPDLARR